MNKFFRNLPRTLFLAGLFAIPFFYLPNSLVPYEVPKVWLFNRWIEVITIFGLVFSTPTIRKQKTDTFLVILLVSFISMAFVSSLVGADFQKSLLGNYYRSDGLLTLFHLASLFFFIVLFFQKKWLKPMFTMISLSAIGISLWVLYDAFRLYVLGNPAIYNWEGALAVSFGNPNFLSGYLLVTLPFTLYLMTSSPPHKAGFPLKEDDISGSIHPRPEGRGFLETVISTEKIKKKYFVAGIIFQIIAILLTFTRAGIVGVTIFAFLWLAIWKKVKVRLIILLVLIFIIIIPYLIQGETTYKSGVLVSESRQRIYTKAYMAFIVKPLMGWGWANFDYAFDSINWPIKIEDDVYVDKAHSMILEVLTTTGLFGFLLYLTFIGKSIKNLASDESKTSKYLLMSLVLYVLHSQINIISISEEMIFWITAGISAKRSLFH